jgi:hypothetical protein
MPGIWRMQEGWTWPDEPYLFMAEGWQQGEDGIWRVNQRARQRHGFLSGRVHDVRRHPNPSPPNRASSTSPTDMDAPRGSAKGQIAHHLPSLAVCPFCGTPQRLEPAVLGVAPRNFKSMEPGRHYARPEDRQD